MPLSVTRLWWKYNWNSAKKCWTGQGSTTGKHTARLVITITNNTRAICPVVVTYLARYVQLAMRFSPSFQSKPIFFYLSFALMFGHLPVFVVVHSMKFLLPEIYCYIVDIIVVVQVDESMATALCIMTALWVCFLPSGTNTNASERQTTSRPSGEHSALAPSAAAHK